MKIVLIRYHDEGNINTRLPESLNKNQGVLPPLGLAYIAGALEKAGHNVKVIDAIAENLTKDDVKKIITKFKPTVVGVTSMTPTIRGALEACKIAHDCGAIVVVGGVHLEVYPKETLSYNFVDYGIIGEGEESVVELMDAIENKKPVEQIVGLAYKKNGTIFVNSPRIVKDINNLPLPARHLLPMDKYNSIISLYPMATMVTGRGCPFKCGFCFKRETDKFLRLRDPIKVVDEMEELVNKYKVKEIMFYDDTFVWNKNHVIEICNEILKKNLKVKWEAPTRIDTINKSILELMKKSGCIRLRYGIESGDPAILKLMNKNINIEMAKSVIQMTKDAGIEVFAYFIIGYAQETSETMQRTINFAKELNCDLVMFTVATPCPKTPLYDLAIKNGIINYDYWQQFTLGKVNDRFPYFVKDADKWAKKAYRAFYFRPKYILRQILRIRSFDAFKKHWWALKGLVFFYLSN